MHQFFKTVLLKTIIVIIIILAHLHKAAGVNIKKEE